MWGPVDFAHQNAGLVDIVQGLVDFAQGPIDIARGPVDTVPYLLDPAQYPLVPAPNLGFRSAFANRLGSIWLISGRFGTQKTSLRPPGWADLAKPMKNTSGF